MSAPAARALAALALAAGLAGARAAQEASEPRSPLASSIPRPVRLEREDPSPADLAAVLAEVEAAAADGSTSLCTIEVHNPLSVPAEPLAFRLEWEEAGGEPLELELARVPLPHLGRWGRPAPAGGREGYRVLVPLPPLRVRAARIAVGAACFPAGASGPPPPLPAPRAGGLASGPEGDHVLLENGSDLEVDVTLEVSTAAPAARGLFHERLAPREQRSWTVPPARERGWSGPVGRARDVRLVDACALLETPEAEAAGRAALAAAYASWRTHARTDLGREGSFELDVRGADGAWSASGRFRMQGERVEARPLAGWNDERAAIAREALGRLLGPAGRRPALEDVLDAARPVLVSRAGGEETLSVAQLPALGLEGPALVGIVAGRFAWAGGPALGDRPRIVWRTRGDAGGYWITARETHERSLLRPLAPQREERWLADERDGQLRAFAWRRLERGEDGEVALEARLSIDALGPVPAGAGPLDGEWPPVRGTAAAELRAAWEAPLRYADLPSELRGTVELVAGEAQEGWLGRDVVAARFVLEGLRPGGWSRLSLEVIEPAAPPPEEEPEATPPSPRAAKRRAEERAAQEEPPPPPPELDARARAHLARVLDDRFSAWVRRDFAHRPPFEVVFAGASVARLGDDLVLEDCLYRRVRLRDGLPVRLIQRDGIEVEIVYRPLGHGAWPVEVRRGRERIEVAYARQGGLVLPQEVQLHEPGTAPQTLLLGPWRW